MSVQLALLDRNYFQSCFQIQRLELRLRSEPIGFTGYGFFVVRRPVIFGVNAQFLWGYLISLLFDQNLLHKCEKILFFFSIDNIKSKSAIQKWRLKNYVSSEGLDDIANLFLIVINQF